MEFYSKYHKLTSSTGLHVKLEVTGCIHISQRAVGGGKPEEVKMFGLGPTN